MIELGEVIVGRAHPRENQLDDVILCELTGMPLWDAHTLGKALLAAGDAAGAEEVYRADLEIYPRNGWALYGLIQSLEAQDKDASEIQARFDKIWAQADVTLTASRF